VARCLIGLVLIWLAGSSTAIAAPEASSAPRASTAVAARHVVVLTVDGTSIQDWRTAGAFRWAGAVSLLATRTPTASADPILYRAGAYSSFGAGAAAEVRRDTAPTKPRGGVLAGALGETLERNGLEATSIGDAIDDRHADAPAGLAVMDADGTVAVVPGARVRALELSATTSRRDPNAPGGWRTDPDRLRAALQEALAWASVVVVDSGDTWRADRAYTRAPETRARWVGGALAQADRFASDVLTTLGSNDMLVVASLVPPLDRVRGGVHLGAVAFSSRRGLPSSGTTRRDGVLSLTDLAPTVLSALAIAAPDAMEGRPARFVPASDPARVVSDLDHDVVRALATRRPLTRLWLIAAAVFAIAAFVTIASGRGRARADARIPIGWRNTIAWGLAASAAAPAAMLIAPALTNGGTAAVGWWTLGLSLGISLVARAAFGHDRSVVAVAGLTSVVVVADLLAGSPLASRSALGFQIAGGGRFYGIDEGLLGVLLAAPLVVAGGVIDAARNRRRAILGAGLLLAAVAVFAAGPSWGSKFGAPYTMVPAFGVFALLAAGVRIDRRGVIGIAIATVLLSGSLAAADALASPESRSHIGREVSGGTPVGPLVGRKLRSLVTITATTVWLPAALALAGPALILLARRPDVGARGLWGKPARRAALWALAVGCVCALGSNDTGIIVVAPALVFGAAAFYAPLLVPD
jgi:hypothetical protein